MSLLNETDPFTLALVIILGLIAILLAIILFFAIRNSPHRANALIIEGMDKAIERFDAATRHHVEVNAVLALLETFKERPSLVERLGEYADQVVAAAILTRINGIGTDITNVTAELSKREISVAKGHEVRYNSGVVERNRETLARLNGELEAMHRLAQRFEVTAPT